MKMKTKTDCGEVTINRATSYNESLNYKSQLSGRSESITVRSTGPESVIVTSSMSMGETGLTVEPNVIQWLASALQRAKMEYTVGEPTDGYARLPKK